MTPLDQFNPVTFPFIVYHMCYFISAINKDNLLQTKKGKAEYLRQFFCYNKEILLV